MNSKNSSQSSLAAEDKEELAGFQEHSEEVTAFSGHEEREKAKLRRRALSITSCEALRALEQYEGQLQEISRTFKHFKDLLDQRIVLVRERLYSVIMGPTLV